MLPSFSLAYALTVHKSQGSGFQNILLITGEKASKLLTREMIYTGITRAEQKVVIWSNKELLLQALECTTIRCSNLQKRLK
jgi:exodeoxyribonuclease V alpha subunit